MTALPPPQSSTDELLVAVHGLLEEIRDRLPARQESAPAGPGQVEILEPASAPLQDQSDGGGPAKGGDTAD